MNILILGGSGFVSGALSRMAVDRGHQVRVVTRGQRPLPPDVQGLVADRNEPGALQRALDATPITFDLAIDCIGYKPEHAQQDVDLLSTRVRQLVFISTDFVFDPNATRLPRDESTPFTTDSGYGRDKRRREEVLLQADTRDMHWVVLRPCHIYGPGSLLGCLPTHGRDAKLLERLRAGDPLRLVGGGHFLQQPIDVDDLARLALACADRPDLHRQIFCTAGPDIIESRRYYQILADAMDVPLHVEEISVASYLAEHSEHRPFLCHRIYDLHHLRDSRLPMPATPIEKGLQRHLAALLEQAASIAT